MVYLVKKSLFITAIAVFLAGCTCGVPLKVTPIQQDDKKLSCKAVILEINEAEHYRDEAADAQGIGLGEALMPMCWISGYLDGSKAKKAANERIDYLGRIYDLMECGTMPTAGEEDEDMSSAPPPPAGLIAAPMTPVAIQQLNNHDMEESDDESEDLPVFDAKNATGKPKMHEHRDKNGKVYMHSHPYNGPHVHAEDLR